MSLVNTGTIFLFLARREAMARYRDDDDGDYFARPDQSRREFSRGYDEPYGRRHRQMEQRRPDYSRGRFGERAEYERDEPRYSNRGYSENRGFNENREYDENRESFGESYRDSRFDRRRDFWGPERRRGYETPRSRL